MKINAAIFDLDGTIADSSYVWQKVDIDFFKKRNMEVPHNFENAISGLSFKEAAVYTKDMYGLIETIDDIMSEWYNMAIYEYSNNVKLKPHAFEYISYLKEKNIKIALCTASPKELFEPFLKNNGVFCLFDAFVSGSEVLKSKEFPDIYLLAAEKLCVKPENCVVFEDIPRAVKGAKAAGMKTIGVFDEASAAYSDELMQVVEVYIKDFLELMTDSPQELIL